MLGDNIYREFEVTGNAQVTDMSTGFGQPMTYQVENFGDMGRGGRMKITPGGKPDDPYEEIPDDIVPEEDTPLGGDMLVLGVLILVFAMVKLVKKLF